MIVTLTKKFNISAGKNCKECEQFRQHPFYPSRDECLGFGIVGEFHTKPNYPSPIDECLEARENDGSIIINDQD